MIAPVEHLGAQPVFYPLRDTGQPDLEFLSQMDCSNIRVMLAAHLFGIPQPLGKVAEFCSSRGIQLIEDCAHCFYGSAAGDPVGLTGDFAIGSLPKFFPVREGGLLAWHKRPAAVRVPGKVGLTSELHAVWDLLDTARRFGRLGALNPLVEILDSTQKRFRRRTPQVTSTDASDPSPELIRAAALRDPLLAPRKIRRVEHGVVVYTNSGESYTKRTLNFCQLAGLLNDLPNATPLFSHCADTSAPYVMPLYLHENADRHYASMRRLRLPVFRWDRVWPGTPSLDGDVATRWARGIVQIACHQSLTAEDVMSIAKAIRATVSDSTSES